MPQTKPILVATKGTVLALNRITGSELWRTKLKGSSSVNLAFDGNDLIATTQGEVFCLDPSNGRILWQNGLRGMGYGLVTIATGEGSQLAALEDEIAESERESTAAINQQTSSV